jgi:hypothetical protein
MSGRAEAAPRAVFGDTDEGLQSHDFLPRGTPRQTDRFGRLPSALRIHGLVRTTYEQFHTYNIVVSLFLAH